MLGRFVHLQECFILTLKDLKASHMCYRDEKEYIVEEEKE